MGLPDFVPVRSAHKFTPSELLTAIVARNNYLLRKPKLSEETHSQLLNDIQILIAVLKQKDPRAKVPPHVLEPTKIWLPRELKSKLLREQFEVNPAMFTRVFYRALPNSATIEGSLFRQLVYNDGYLLLSSLESLMQQAKFERAFLNVHRLRHSSLAFVYSFVPHYREWYLDQKHSEAPRPG